MRTVLAGVFAIGSVVLASAAAEPMLDLRMIGLHEWRPHEKDRALLDAAGKLGERLADLSAEMELDPTGADGLALGWDVLSGGLTLRVDGIDDRGAHAVLVTRPGRTDPAAVYERLGRLMGAWGLPVERIAPDMMSVESPAGVLTLTTDRLGVTARLGEPAPVEAGIGRGDLPADVRPVASLSVETGAWMSLIGPHIAEALGDLPPGLGLGAWLGPDAPSLRMAVGVGDQRMHTTLRWVDALGAMSGTGLDPAVTFNSTHLRKAPRDTVRLYAAPVMTGQYLGLLDLASERMGGDVLAEVNAALGIDLRADLLENIGPRAMVYQSETTGGGGLTSTVLVLGFKDAARFKAVHARLVERANLAGERDMGGRLRVRAWNAGGLEAWSLTLPGLPIPVEPSWALVGTDLVVALTPGALRAAAAQAMGATSSVLDNPRFARAVMERMPQGGAAQIKFADSERLARRGYGLASLATAALANAVRSPASPDRVGGELLPPFADLVAGVEPAATIGWWDGNDYRLHAVGDASLAVGVASALGSVADVHAAMPALAAGVVLPAIGKARQTAMELRATANIRMIGLAMHTYAADNDDRLPESVEELLEAGLLSEELLRSAYGPAPDGGAEIAVVLGGGRFDWDATGILAVDRSMLLRTGATHVLFGDGHVERLTWTELSAALLRPGNERAIEAVGFPGFEGP